jgi:hypothetical protein
MATGENTGTWGNVTNINLGTAIEEAVVGSADVTFASANVTLTLTDTNESQTARNLRLNLTGTTGAARDLIVPAIEKVYIINNGCAHTVTVKNSTGTGIAVPAGKTMYVYNDGTNVVDAITHLTSLSVSGGITGDLTGNVTGNLTGTASNATVLQTARTIAISGGATGTATSFNGGANITIPITALNVSTANAGTLANARTTANSANGASTIVARDASGNFAAGTITASLTGNASTATTLQTARNFRISGGATAANVSFNGSAAINLSVTALNVATANAGTLAVARGGTGVTASGTSGNVLTSNGSAWVSQAAPVPESFPSGTLMLFQQTAAPTGWTKQTTHNNKALRVVTGTASSGGSVAFTTAFASKAVTGTVSVSATTGQVAAPVTVGNRTLSTPQIPSHAHNAGSAGQVQFSTSPYAQQVRRLNSSSPATANAGGGGSHNHPGSGGQHAHPVSAPATFSGTAINLAVQYVDLIIAAKD